MRLLEMKLGSNQRCSLPLEVLDALEPRLQQPQGFKNYKAI